jgi:hypothetical protein
MAATDSVTVTAESAAPVFVTITNRSVTGFTVTVIGAGGTLPVSGVSVDWVVIAAK